jgi:SNF2 family DNA or RNA helicase
MIYSAAHDCVVYTPREPARVLACMPEARAVNGASVAVPFTLRNMLVAKQIGLPAVSPIETHYDWPGRFKPYAHQRQMAAFMTMNPRCFNLADMGTGKTLAALWAADYLMDLGYIKKALVLSPLSTLNRVWMDEIFTHFLGRRTGVILHGERSDRLAGLSEPHDFYIVNHDGLGVGTARRSGRGLILGELAARIAADPDIGLVIVDEASAYKNSATRRFKILNATLQNKPYIWLMTGTPTPNEPTDAWALRKLADPKIESLVSFKDRTMFRLSQFKWLPRKDAHQTVSAFLQPAIRFARADCLDLPPVTVETREVELSPRQKTAFEEMRKDLQLTMAAGGPITAVNEAALRMKLIQIACGAIYDQAHVSHLTEAGPRIAALKEVVEQAGAKCLVFAPLTAVVKLIYAELAKAGWSCAMVTGDVSQKERSEVFRAFQQEVSPRVIVADPGTMAHGLTLTAADTVIWYGPTDRPELYEQANARINRPGQLRKMLIVRLAATKIEREIYKRLHEKQSLQGLVLDLVRGDLQ